MIASIIHDSSIRYPDESESFSPSKRYPEYPFGHVATRTNMVYQAVRNCLAQAGLDAANLDTPAWNPLGTFIRKGSKVFVLCNFVYHRRPQESLQDFRGKCTHGSVLRAIVDYIHIATGTNGQVHFGNAPLQSCDWGQVLADTGAAVLPDFYAANGVEVSAHDLRLLIAPRSILGQGKTSHAADNREAVTISLDKDSLLEPLYSVGNDVRLRVSDYNPDRTEGFHSPGKHTYVINKDILTSDVVLSVPKLKTHEKVGITVGLKGFVGSVGHKDCLAHHRFGSPQLHGDEYPNDSALRVLLSKFHDFVQRRRYPRLFASALQIVDTNARRISRRLFRQIQAGAWHGNDTAWRMALDLTRIVHFANSIGTMSAEMQRRHLVLIDGIVAGEGNGPLSPSGLNVGALVFCDNAVCGDILASKLMGYPPHKIPMIANLINDPKLSECPRNGVNSCTVNGKGADVDRLPPIAGRAFAPPDGWKNFLP